MAHLTSTIFEAGHADAICFTPIRFEETIIGVLVCEYETTEFASRQSTHQQDLARLVGPSLKHAIRWQKRPLKRTSTLIENIIEKPKAAGVKSLITFGILAFLVWFLFFFQVGIFVRGDARLEPANLAIATAPHGGTVAEILVKVNEQVKKGQPLLLIDDTDLQLEHSELTRMISQEEVQKKQYLQQGKRAEWSASELRIMQHRIRLQAVERKLSRCEVLSPMAGVVLNDDLDVLKGMTVKEGQHLIQLADLSEFKLVIDVPEQDLVLVEQRVKNGQYVPVEFLSHANPEQPQTAEVSSLKALSPTNILDEKQQHHVYRVTVPIELKGISTGLALANRTGRAKLDVGEGSIAWRYLRDAWHFMKVTILF